MKRRAKKTKAKKRPASETTKDAAELDEEISRVVFSKFRYGGRVSWRSNRDVSNDLKISSQKVQHLLDLAIDRGLVVPWIKVPHDDAEVRRLEDAVCSRFGLKKVILVSGDPRISLPLEREARRPIQTDTLRSMAERLSQYLDEIVRARFARSLTIGVAWGRTMGVLAEYLQATRRRAQLKTLEVLPIVGATSSLNRERIEAGVVAVDIATAYGGRALQLPCPAFWKANAEKVIELHMPDVYRTLKRLVRCDVVITSMGPIPAGERAGDEITLSADTAMNERLFRAAREHHAIGEICCWFFDKDGVQTPTEYESVGLGFRGLQAVAADPERQVILMAGGDRRRFEPLRAALRAKLASVLVSDTVTARYLLGELNLKDGVALE